MPQAAVPEGLPVVAIPVEPHGSRDGAPPPTAMPAAAGDLQPVRGLRR